jgi:hypothetical protein
MGAIFKWFNVVQNSLLSSLVIYFYVSSERSPRHEAMFHRGIGSFRKEKMFQKRRSQKIKNSLKVIKVGGVLF